MSIDWYLTYIEIGGSIFGYSDRSFVRLRHGAAAAGGGGGRRRRRRATGTGSRPGYTRRTQKTVLSQAVASHTGSSQRAATPSDAVNAATSPLYRSSHQYVSDTPTLRQSVAQLGRDAPTMAPTMPVRRVQSTAANPPAQQQRCVRHPGRRSISPVSRQPISSGLRQTQPGRHSNPAAATAQQPQPVRSHCRQLSSRALEQAQYTFHTSGQHGQPTYISESTVSQHRYISEKHLHAAIETKQNTYHITRRKQRIAWCLKTTESWLA